MSPRPSTTPVRAPHRFDQAALEHYLARHVPGAVPIRAVSQFAAGQSNPTYLIEEREQVGAGLRKGGRAGGVFRSRCAGAVTLCYCAWAPNEPSRPSSPLEAPKVPATRVG